MKLSRIAARAGKNRRHCRSMLTLVVTLCWCIGGCQVVSKPCCTQQGSEPVLEHRTAGFVTTSGMYARRRTLQIPELGLTLGEAVEASLRPGLRTAVAMPVAVVAAQPPKTPATKGKPLLRSREFITAWKDALADDGRLSRAYAMMLVQELESDDLPTILAIRDFMFAESVDAVISTYDADEPEDQHVVLDRTLQAMKSQPGGDGFMMDAEQAEQAEKILRALVRQGTLVRRESIRKAFADSFASELGVEAVTQWLQQQRSTLFERQPTEETFSEALDKVRRILAAALADPCTVADRANGETDDPTDRSPQNEVVENDDAEADSGESPAQPSVAAGAVVSTSSLRIAVVTLHRGDHPTKFIPLPLVDSTPAGDLALRDGDRIEVIPLEQTSLLTRELDNAPGGRMMMSGLVRGEIDLDESSTLGEVSQRIEQTEYAAAVNLFVVGIFDEDDQREEYWLPRPGAGLLPVAGFDWSGIRLSPRDSVRSEALQLISEIRRSHLSQRIDQIESRQRMHFQQLRERKAEAETRLIDQIRGNPFYQTLSRGLQQFSAWP
jgi:hypothetical protein